MLTQKQKDWLIRLSMYLVESEGNQGCQFEIKEAQGSGQKRIVISFPYGKKIKDELDKDNKNFDYKVNALFNQKLIEAMYLIVFINKYFQKTNILKLAEQLAKEELEQETKML